MLDTYFSLLRRPSNPLASLRLVTKDGSDSFVENLIHGSVQREVPALTRADHVCCADKTGVVRTNNVAKLKGIFQIGNGQPNEAVLPVSPPAVGVAR